MPKKKLGIREVNHFGDPKYEEICRMLTAKVLTLCPDFEYKKEHIAKPPHTPLSSKPALYSCEGMLGFVALENGMLTLDQTFHIMDQLELCTMFTTQGKMKGECSHVFGWFSKDRKWLGRNDGSGRDLKENLEVILAAFKIMYGGKKK